MQGHSEVWGGLGHIQNLSPVYLGVQQVTNVNQFWYGKAKNSFH